MIYIQLQNWGKNVLVTSLKYTKVTQSILRSIFLMYVAILQRLNNSGQEFNFFLLLVFDCDIPVTLKQGQGHQTRYELVDSKSNQETHELSLLNMCESQE